MVEIRSTGDILLDVAFKNTSQVTKSIPKDALRTLRTKKLPIPSPRIIYRVRLETLKKHSEYFQILLKPQFAEGLAVAEAFARFKEQNEEPANVVAERLPIIKIVDEDVATKTFGRETVFRDLLRVVHGTAEPLTTPFTTQCLVVLVLMADRYNLVPYIAKHFQKTLLNHKYPIPVSMDKNAEEILRQKILVQYHTDQGPRFTTATKELIIRGSFRWNGYEDTSAELQTPWWDLPHGLEVELSYRRACVLRTIASIQNQFLQIYSSKERQCKLGYDSSSSCDSFQLGEMVKFLTKKGLLNLVPFQAVSPDDPEYIWPEAYTSDIDTLIGVLRQCPSYQIDKHHSHCGLRTKLLPALDYIKSCMDTGLGIKLARSSTGPSFESWIPVEAHSYKRSFWVGTGEGEDVDTSNKAKVFHFSQARPRTAFGTAGGGEKFSKALFLAEKWNWVTEAEGNARPFFPGGNLIR